MRIIYVVYFGEDNIYASGVFKKIFSQIETLRKNNNDVKLCYCYKNSINLISENDKQCFKAKKGLSNYRKSMNNFLLKISEEYDALYIRMPGFIDSFSYTLYKKLKHKGKKIILEIPTYPLGGELKTTLKHYLIKGKILHFLSRIFSYSLHFIYIRGIHKYIYEIVTFMPYTNIWKTKTLVIDNGVDTAKCEVIKEINHDSFNIISVAKVAVWHGIDRCIRGLYDYYSKENDKLVKLTIVGSTEYCDTLKKLVKELNLDDKVSFVGEKSGEELYYLYCMSDIALGSLGMHRINMVDGSTLKVKEYCSYGIPFVYGYNERSLTDGFPYALKVEATDENLSINALITFINSLKNVEKVHEKMNEFAKDNFDWSIQMKPVIDSLEDEDE